MSFPPHLRYKPSGFEWLGDVPEHWKVKRLKLLFEIKKRIAGSEDFDVLSVTQRGLKVKDIDSNDGQLSSDYSKYQLVYPGEFAMNHMDLLTGYVDLSRQLGVTSPDYRVFALRDSSNSPRYFLNLLQNAYHEQLFFPFGQGSSQLGRWRLPTDQFNEFVFPCPPTDEQEKIATFIGLETAKIDALVEEQKRLIDLLKEKRQAVITQAVTKGLNPNVSMKPSGIEWLGDVPAHWEVLPLKRLLCSIEQGWSPECHSYPAAHGEWGVLKSGCVNGGVFRSGENKALPEGVEPIPDYEIRTGDLLMSRASGSPDLIGSAALVRDVPPHLMLSDKIFRLNLGNLVSKQYLVILLSSSQLRTQIELAISGAEGLANNLPQSRIREFVCSVPPLSEQEMIVERLADEVQRFENLCQGASKSIELLQERRSALISAAVTGKIDVRGLVQSNEADQLKPDRMRVNA